MDYDRDLTWVENLKIQSYSEHPEVKTAANELVSAFYKNKSRKRDQKGFTRDARKLVASLWLHEQWIAVDLLATPKLYNVVKLES